MTVQAGIVCGACDWLNSHDRSACEDCGNELYLPRVTRADDGPPEKSAVKTSEAIPRTVKTLPEEAAQQEAEEKPMEQARHYICKSCYSPVPSGHKFCGKCGTVADSDVARKEPDFFGDMQTPGKAKLILIKGEGMDGISYHLNSTEHVAGRVQGAILFTEDKWLSPKHANFFYDDSKLMIRDENSVNGVFLCARGPTDIPPGTVFLAGEQVFRVDEVAPFEDEPEEDGTYFFASPRQESAFRVVQILEGSGEGIVVTARDNQVTIGREASDINFPNDAFISGKHVKIELVDGVLRLVDLGSKNGTYIRMKKEQELIHGDYLFLGRQLLRVEITN
ncbi:MAG: FHA domain-containing protein [Proteobacteria bacterium]|nr:FHA domain-containing protein [Pseudomonadota bacterium]